MVVSLIESPTIKQSVSVIGHGENKREIKRSESYGSLSLSRFFS